MVSISSGSNGASKISFGGLASGIDTNSILDALIAAEQRPILIAQAKLAGHQQRQAAITGISGSIASLASAAAALNDASVVGARRVSTDQASSDTPKFAVSASSAAAVGSFTVQVLGLATNTNVTSTAAMGTAVTQNVALASGGFSTPVTAGTFSINGVAITIDANTVLSDGADLTGANTIIAKIADAGVGVTATIVDDGAGRMNALKLDSATAIQLGSGADTSNFLSAANLLQSPGTTSRTSTRPLAGTSLSAVLSSARLSTALGTASGAFTVNGVSISWNSATDTMSQVISRINSSTAGVTATYDTVTDRLVLTAKQTGSSTVALADVTGNFLAATRVLAATPALGANASYQVNSGATQYASSNVVTDAVAGVTLSLVGLTTSAVKVTISADNSALRNRMQTFVDAFNGAMSVINAASKYGGGNGASSGPMFGDPSMQRMQAQLRSLITQPATGITGDLTSLSSLGLNFGNIGSAVGTTKTLALNASKLDAAMSSNPDGVARLLTAFTASATLDAGGGGSVLSISGNPTLAKTAGKYSIASAPSGQTTVTFTPDDGSALVISTGTLVANSTNTTMIPGVTITTKPVLVTGTDRITVVPTEQGIGRIAASLLGALNGPNGPLTAGNTAMTNSITDINAQIAKLTTRVADKRAVVRLRPDRATGHRRRPRAWPRGSGV